MIPSSSLGSGLRDDHFGKALPPHAIAEAERIGKRDNDLVIVDARYAILEVLGHWLRKKDAAYELLRPVLLAERIRIELGILRGNGLFHRPHNMADDVVTRSP